MLKGLCSKTPVRLGGDINLKTKNYVKEYSLDPHLFLKRIVLFHYQSEVVSCSEKMYSPFFLTGNELLIDKH